MVCPCLGRDESRNPHFYVFPGQTSLCHIWCKRTVVCLIVLSVLLAISSFLSAWNAIANSSIYEFEQPSPSKQSGNEFKLLRGVNLGGWLVLEPWIVPSLFYQFQHLDLPAVDEKSFCKVLGTAEAKRQLDAFREAWVTERDFMKFKEIGLNAVRIPYGYWSWGDQSDFCPNISSIHFLDRAVDWAEKYGMRVLLDLHAAKGSQNGFDNSGESFRKPWSAKWHDGEDPAWDAEAWTRSPNVETTRNILARTVGRYSARTHVTMFGLLNEPNGFFTFECKEGSCPLDKDILVKYYEDAYLQTKEAIGPWASPVLDVAFRPSIWQSLRRKAWLTAGRWGAMMDSHKYFAFFPFGGSFPQIYYLRTAACAWRDDLEWQHNEQLPTIIGEWSLATTDCMTWLNGYGLPAWWNAQSTCSYVPCPETFGKFPKGKPLAGLEDTNVAGGVCPIDPLYAPRGKLSFEEFFTHLARYQMRGHERSRGWFFWNFKCEVSDPRWCFLDAWERGWFPKNLSIEAYSPPVPRCDVEDTPFGSYWDALLLGTISSFILSSLLFCWSCACFVSRYGRQCADAVCERSPRFCRDRWKRWLHKHADPEVDDIQEMVHLSPTAIGHSGTSAT